MGPAEGVQEMAHIKSEPESQLEELVVPQHLQEKTKNIGEAGAGHEGCGQTVEEEEPNAQWVKGGNKSLC